jgi:excisionase family DNA binding protein
VRRTQVKGAEMQIDDNVPLSTEQLKPVAMAKAMAEIYTINQAKNLLNIGHTTLYKLAKEREITIIKVFGKSLVVGLREFIDRKVSEARQPKTVN